MCEAAVYTDWNATREDHIICNTTGNYELLGTMKWKEAKEDHDTAQRTSWTKESNKWDWGVRERVS